MIRLDTTAETFASAAWAPDDETVFQLSTDSTAVVVDVQARVAPTLPWATVTSLHIHTQPIARVALLPSLRLVMRGNGRHLAVQVWDNA